MTIERATSVYRFSNEAGWPPANATSRVTPPQLVSEVDPGRAVAFRKGPCWLRALGRALFRPDVLLTSPVLLTNAGRSRGSRVIFAGIAAADASSVLLDLS